MGSAGGSGWGAASRRATYPLHLIGVTAQTAINTPLQEPAPWHASMRPAHSSRSISPSSRVGHAHAGQRHVGRRARRAHHAGQTPRRGAGDRERRCHAIERQLRAWIADPQIDVVITTGGTGITGRDVTPEAFDRVLEKRIEGFGELFRMLGYQKIGTSTMQSRALGGVAGGTYLFALPGSTGAVKDAWDDILLHSSTTAIVPAIWSS